MGILLLTQRSMVRVMCVVQVMDGKIDMVLMLVLVLNETMNQLAMASSVHWCGHVLKREDDHMLRQAFQFDVVGQWKRRWSNRTWKKQVEEENMMVGLRREDVLCRSMWSVGINKIAARLT